MYRSDDFICLIPENFNIDDHLSITEQANIIEEDINEIKKIINLISCDKLVISRPYTSRGSEWRYAIKILKELGFILFTVTNEGTSDNYEQFIINFRETILKNRKLVQQILDEE